MCVSSISRKHREEFETDGDTAAAVGEGSGNVQLYRWPGPLSQQDGNILWRTRTYICARICFLILFVSVLFIYRYASRIISRTHGANTFTNILVNHAHTLTHQPRELFIYIEFHQAACETEDSLIMESYSHVFVPQLVCSFPRCLSFHSKQFPVVWVLSPPQMANVWMSMKASRVAKGDMRGATWMNQTWTKHPQWTFCVVFVEDSGVCRPLCVFSTVL